MRRDTLLIQAAVLVASAAAVIALVNRASRPTAQAKLWSGPPASASTVTVSGPLGKVVLARKGGGWELKAPLSYPAQSSLVQSLLDKVSGAALGEALTESPDKQALFGLSAASATRIDIAGAAPVTFYAGRSGAEYGSLYVRLGEAPAVYEAGGLSSYDVARGSADWMSRDILTVPSDALRSLVLRSSNSWTLSAGTGGSWRLGENGPKVSTGTGTAFDSVATVFKSLQADQVLLAPFAGLPKKPALEVSVSWTEAGKAKQAVLSVYPAKDSLTPVVVRGEDRVHYLLYSWKLDALRRPASAFH